MSHIRYLIEPHGEVFQIRRGDSSHEAKGMKNREKSTGRPYVGFYPDADLAAGDQITGTVSGSTYNIVEVETAIFMGKPFQRKAFYETRERRSQGASVHIGSMVNSAFQLDSPGSVQSVSVSQQYHESVADVLNAIGAALDQLPLDDDEREELTAEIQTVESQLRVKKPKATVIKECLLSIKGVLERAAVASAAAGTAEVTRDLLKRVIGLLTEG